MLYFIYNFIIFIRNKLQVYKKDKVEGVMIMKSMELVGLNIKWLRYQKGWTQEYYANTIKFDVFDINYIEAGSFNLTCETIDLIASSFGVAPRDLFSERTAKLAKKLPKRVEMYAKMKS